MKSENNFVLGTLDEVAEITMGQSPKGETVSSISGVPLLNGPAEFGDYFPVPHQYTSDPKRMAKKGDLLFCVRGSTGKMNWANQDYAIGRGLASIRSKFGQEVNNYLRALLEMKVEELKSSEVGSVITGIKKDDLFKLQIPILEKKDLEKMNFIISQFDEKIETIQTLNEELNTLLTKIFQSWFIDFKFNKKVGLKDNEISKFYKKYYETDIGEIPEDWRLSKIGDELEVMLGGTPSRKIDDYWGGDIGWINSGEINKFRIINPTEYISKEGYESSSTKLLPKRTTLIAITGATLGQVSLNEIEVCTNQSVIGIIGSNNICSEYVYLWIKSTIDKLIANQTGGAQQHINTGNVKEHLVLIPPQGLLKKFENIAKPIFDKIELNVKELEKLKELRKLIIPKIVYGNINISNFNETTL